MIPLRGATCLLAVPLVGCTLDPLPCVGTASGDAIRTSYPNLETQLSPRSATLTTWSGDPVAVLTPNDDACTQIASQLGLATSPSAASWSWVFISVGAVAPGTYQVLPPADPGGPSGARFEIGHYERSDDLPMARVLATGGTINLRRFDYDPGSPDQAIMDGSYEVTFPNADEVFAGSFVAPSCAACFSGEP